MRPVLHGDVSNAARALFAVPADRRAAFCTQLLQEAEDADRHVLETGTLHPKWGDGSLMSAARKHPLALEPSFDHCDYCACIELIMRQLQQHFGTRQAGRCCL